MPALAAASRPPPALAPFDFARPLPPELRPTDSARRLFVALAWRDRPVELRALPPGTAFTLPLGARPLELVRATSDGARLVLPENAPARIRSGDRDLTPRDLVLSGRARSIDVPCSGSVFDLALDEVVELESNGLRLVVRWMRPERAPARSLFARLDAGFLSNLGIALLAAFVLTRMIALTDFGTSLVDSDLRKNPVIERVVEVMAPPLPKPKKTVHATAMSGVKRAGLEGKRGARKGDPKDRKLGGLLDVLAKSGGVGAVFGPGGNAGLANALNHLGQTTIADNGPGWGPRGNGTGGGGHDELGIGDSFTGDGTGSDPAGRRFGLDFGKHHEVKLPPPSTILVENMDRGVIERIVRRHWNELKSCYETALLKDPNLAGKVAVFFRIDPVGGIDEAHVAETSMHSDEVEACILRNVRRWQFPAPKGGGTVDVTYPFLFQTN